MSSIKKGEMKNNPNRKQNVKEKPFEGCKRSWLADVMSYTFCERVHTFLFSQME